MIVASVFELNSIKDQISLISVLTAHIDWNKYESGELDMEDYKTLLSKMDRTVKNLQEKKVSLEQVLNK